MSIVNRFPGAELRPTGSFGYPYVGSPRRVKPTILSVIHITDSYGVPAPSERKSWTFVVERNGHVIQFLDPITQSPWTNGVVTSPDTSNPLIAAAVQSGFNLNEWCLVTIENVGAISAAGQLITSEQLAADAAILQWASGLSGLPMDRTHVIGHYQIDALNRQRCPTLPSDRDRVFRGILGLPDTAMEDAMPAWVANIKPLSDPFRGGVGGGTNIRFSPSLAADQVAFQTPGNSGLGVVAHEVAGDPYGGSTQWFVYAPSSGGLRCVHSSQITSRTPLEADCSAVEAKLATATTSLATATARGEHIKDESLKALVSGGVLLKTAADRIRAL